MYSYLVTVHTVCILEYCRSAMYMYSYVLYPDTVLYIHAVCILQYLRVSTMFQVLCELKFLTLYILFNYFSKLLKLKF